MPAPAPTFGTTGRGRHIQILDKDGQWLPEVTLMEVPRPCRRLSHDGCCEAYAFHGVGGRPEPLHAAADALVRLVSPLAEQAAAVTQ